MTSPLLSDLTSSTATPIPTTAKAGESAGRSSGAPKASPIRFVPPEPENLEQTGLTEHDLQVLALKLLLKRGTLSGRQIADSMQLPRPLVQETLEKLRAELLISIKGAAGLEDYIFQLTEAGFERARREAKICTYADAAPVPLEVYIDSVQRQSLQQSSLSLEQLRKTLHHLQLNEGLLSSLGQAINDGRGLFLYGSPGNGKTSLSELVVSAFGEYLWIPRTINIDGELVRVYDPRCHESMELPQLEEMRFDRRWILVRRPTIMVGGELTMQQLDLQFNPQTGLSEAPVQLRANGGALVVDDFGRQRMPTSELLNRLIVPMEKHHDYLSLSSGRQVSVPFDMLLVFSTNLEPRDLVDEAFLRRIPYKIEVSDPSRQEFIELFLTLARQLGCKCEAATVEQLLTEHYLPHERPLRFCHPRDLLRQICNYCNFHESPLEANRQTMGIAVRNYFAGL